MHNYTYKWIPQVEMFPKSGSQKEYKDFKFMEVEQ